MIRLTNYGSAAMLSSSISRSTGIGVPESHGASRPISGFFMREIFSVLYVGLGEAAARLAGSCVRYANLIQFGSIIGVVLPGLKPITHEVIQMTNQATQGNTAQKPTKFHSLFNLIKRTAEGPRVICQDLTFAQATSLVAEIPAAIVKFSHMEVMQ